MAQTYDWGVRIKLTSGSPGLRMVAGGKLFYWLNSEHGSDFLMVRKYSILEPNETCRKELHHQNDKYS